MKSYYVSVPVLRAAFPFHYFLPVVAVLASIVAPLLENESVTPHPRCRNHLCQRH